jgi:hypothetical protein
MAVRSATHLPDPATDPRAGETALAVALGGAICPVPFVMSVAAIRIAGPDRTTRRARIAHRLAVATIVVQAPAIVAVAVLLAT